MGVVFGAGPSVRWMRDIPAQRGAHHQPVLSPGLTETCRDCGQRSLDYLGELKDKQTLGRAELGDVRRALRGVLGLAQVDNGELVFTLKKKKKRKCGFSCCPELKLEMLAWSQHFGVVCPGDLQVLVHFLSTETLPDAWGWSPSDQLMSFSSVPLWYTPEISNFPAFRCFLKPPVSLFH